MNEYDITDLEGCRDNYRYWRNRVGEIALQIMLGEFVSLPD